MQHLPILKICSCPCQAGPKQFVGNSGVEQQIDDAQFLRALVDLRNSAGHGQVYQNGAEAHGEQQRRFHLFADGQIDQQSADAPHDHVLPLQVQKVFV